MEDPQHLSERLLGGPDKNNEPDLDYHHQHHHEDEEEDDNGPSMIVVDPFLASGRDNHHHNHHGTPQYRDAPFAIAFCLQLLVILLTACFWGIPVLSQQREDEEENVDEEESPHFHRLGGLLGWIFVTSCLSLGMAAMCLEFITRHAKSVIHSCLAASCMVSSLVTFSLLTKGEQAAGWFMMGMTVLMLWYTYSVWHRVAFSAANLQTALEAIQRNYGVCGLAYLMALCANLWTVLWCVAMLGVQYRHVSCENDDDDTTTSACPTHQGNAFLVLLLILSYHWTSQVIHNVLHVTVAGVIGTWWFAPQDCQSLSSPIIMDSFRRSTTTSFGSICLGSLVVAIVQTLEDLVREMSKRRESMGMLLCVLECLLQLLQGITQFVNRYAFVYVGLYGYDYMTAGRKVMTLFQERGWTLIVNDNLVHRTLLLVAFVTAALTGVVGLILGRLTGWATAVFGSGSDADVPLFFLSFFIGLSLALILMRVLSSAVDTIIVSFAEAPAEFETNHPALSVQMKDAWRQVYPEECGF